GIMFQDFHLLPDRSAYDNVLLTAICESRLPEKPRSRTIRALNSVGLASKVEEYPQRLSTGEQQRVALARAIVNEPYVLLADEPVSNLDGQTSAEIIEVLRRINRAGTAVVVATHQPERFEICRPRVLRLENGRMVNE
ncbi:MAG: ATP-binding cassette domain-containing protein, partial [Calditrichota bacterium]